MNSKKQNINDLIREFKNKDFLKRYRASQKLLALGENAQYALLEALDSSDPDIVDFAVSTLIWSKNISLIPIIIQRMGDNQSVGGLLHAIYRVLLGYGDLIVPYVIDKLDQGKSYLQLLLAIEEMIGSRLYPPKQEFSVLREFEDFVKELNCLMVAPAESLHFQHIRRLKQWWKKNEVNLPQEIDRSFLSGLFSKPLPQFWDHKSNWMNWWKENKCRIGDYLNKAYTESVMQSIASEEEDGGEGSETDFYFPWMQEEEEVPDNPLDTLLDEVPLSHEKLIAVKVQWLSYWKKHRQHQERISRSSLWELYQPLWCLEMLNLREATESLNDLAFKRMLAPKRGSIPKSSISLLTNIINQTDGFIHLLGNNTDYSTAIAKLIFSIGLELLGKREEARLYLERDVKVYGHCSLWWFTIDYYKHQALARILYKTKRYKSAFQNLSKALDLAKHILHLRSSSNWEELPFPLESAAQNLSENQELPSVGKDFPYLYFLQYKILQAWDVAKKGL